MGGGKGLNAREKYWKSAIIQYVGSLHKTFHDLFSVILKT